MENHNEVLLKVDHLCQYFRMGRKDMKAVDDVSFEIKKGEAFGLVGESGCGKTTTGRSIIKLYDITSGNIYFKGHRIGAGIRSYKDAIKKAKADFAAKTISEVDYKAIVAQNRALIRDAKADRTSVDKQYAATLIAALNKEYEEKMASAANDPMLLKALTKEYKNKLRVAKRSKLSTQIQMIFQDPIASLDPRMTVRDIIAEGLVINGITDKEYINQKVYEILETVGLVREHADRYPHEFSGGQRQRIGVARALIMEPSLIIADEPISALDVSIRAQVINLLDELRNNMGISILFIAHDLSVVKYFSDRIGVMYYGKMVELADSEELFKHPFHPYTRSLLSAIPQPDPNYEKNRKRIVYNPIADHDYRNSQPTFREVLPGHFVLCNDEEFERYQSEVK